MPPITLSQSRRKAALALVLCVVIVATLAAMCFFMASDILETYAAGEDPWAGRGTRGGTLLFFVTAGVTMLLCSTIAPYRALKKILSPEPLMTITVEGVHFPAYPPPINFLRWSEIQWMGSRRVAEGNHVLAVLPHDIEGVLAAVAPDTADKLRSDLGAVGGTHVIFGQALPLSIDGTIELMKRYRDAR